jgi:hypothetical protein
VEDGRGTPQLGIERVGIAAGLGGEEVNHV